MLLCITCLLSWSKCSWCLKWAPGVCDSYEENTCYDVTDLGVVRYTTRLNPKRAVQQAPPRCALMETVVYKVWGCLGCHAQVQVASSLFITKRARTRHLTAFEWWTLTSIQQVWRSSGCDITQGWLQSPSHTFLFTVGHWFSPRTADWQEDDRPCWWSCVVFSTELSSAASWRRVSCFSAWNSIMGGEKKKASTFDYCWRFLETYCIP